MGEIAPGLHVSDLVPEGTAYLMNIDVIGGRGVVMSWRDWRRLDPANREALADEITRHSAEAGLAKLERMLAAGSKGKGG